MMMEAKERTEPVIRRQPTRVQRLVDLAVLVVTTVYSVCYTDRGARGGS